ncbi:Tryptophan--tRNA ligase mitochondrial [Taenia solium]|eukprot:TsM_000887200 transcript=TsM_000887200 gene=TsM_000887200
MAQHIGEQVVGSTELVREANEHLRQSMDKTRKEKADNTVNLRGLCLRLGWRSEFFCGHVDPVFLPLTYKAHMFVYIEIVAQSRFNQSLPSWGMLKHLSCRSFQQVSILGSNQIRMLYATGQHRQIVVTGIQPTGYPHLGNYFGMIKPCVKIQTDRNVDRFFLLIADLHALTKRVHANDQAQSTLRLASALLACGINPALESEDSSFRGRTILFPQSSVTGHCELAWILASQCTVKRLAHLPQWREKSEAAGEVGASAALFTYPLLMAADVLLYAADFVPVGADQVTHLELTRDLARVILTFWPALRGILKSPCLKLTETPKVYNLRDPTKKMSKSLGPDSGTIWLTDPPDTIRSKVVHAQTDSVRQLTYDPVTRPGVANLMQIFAAAKGVPLQEAVEHLVKLSKVELKNAVTDVIVEELAPIQTRLTELESSGFAQKALSAGARVANLVASQNLRKIKEVDLRCLFPEKRKPLGEMLNLSSFGQQLPV